MENIAITDLLIRNALIRRFLPTLHAHSAIKLTVTNVGNHVDGVGFMCARIVLFTPKIRLRQILTFSVVLNAVFHATFAKPSILKPIS